MAINKKLIHFNTFENFNSKKLSANSENTQYTLGVNGEIQTGSPEILYQSIVYIKDVKLQWTHGQLFDSDANIQAIDSSEILDDVETNTYVKYVAQALSETQKTQTRLNIDAVSYSDLQTNLDNKQDIITDLDEIRTKAINSVQQESLALVATSGSYKDLSDTPNAVSESTVSGWGFAKSSALQTKAEDSSVVHKTGNESITGVKTFNSGVNFLGSGDSNAVTLSTNTRINVNGTNKTVLGFSSNTFYINHGDYSLLLRGKDTRPTYNSTTLALSSDVNGKQDTLVSGTNIKTINGESIIGEGNINIESGSEQVQSDWNETDNTSPAYIANKPDIYVNDEHRIVIDNIAMPNTIGLSSTNDIGQIGIEIGMDNITWYGFDGEGETTHTITSSGDGTKFLSDDGTYKEISSNSSSSGAYSEVNHGTSDTTFTLTPNTFHVWDEVTTLDLSFGEETEGIANEFLFQFTSGSTATTLTLPDTIKWANNEVPTIEANMIYQVSILKGLASVLVFDNTPQRSLITFSILSLEAQAEEGMTWGEWTISSYNTLNCNMSGNYILRTGAYVTLSGVYITTSDLIIADTEYHLTHPSAGAD